ncbi:MAG TPA: RsmE family RNA methyltransferase [Candidatus Tumulicola sp.]|nr:RsmE family RNA methyltransferase [Candidatus Tumulicola sp.]
MSRPRFFVSQTCGPGREIELDALDARHATLVLRMKAGGEVTLVRDGVAWNATLSHVGADGVRATCAGVAAGERGELPLDVSLLQGVTKGAKFDFVVEKAVELGVRRIVPVECERSSARAGQQKIDRWRRIARAAAEQSRRVNLPTVEATRDWASAVREAAGKLIVAVESAPPGSLAPIVRALKARDVLTIAVGPEGSFTESELETARAAGATLVSLGPTILRTETAAMALLAAIASHFW